MFLGGKSLKYKRQPLFLLLGLMMKGVVLAGGFGTRLYPLTKVTNKHLLPVYNKPMICYPIETLLRMGITEIMIVTGIEFAGDFLRILGHGEDFIAELNRWNNTYYPPVSFHYAVQKGSGGIADALRLAELFVAKDSVAVILGDNIFQDDFSEYTRNFTGGSVVFLKEVEDNKRFGVPIIDSSSQRILGIEEKPLQPQSPYAVTGLYLYDHRIFDVIRAIAPSTRGELEITDVNNWFIQQAEMRYVFVKDFWSDAGTIESLHSASALIREKMIIKNKH